MGAMEEMIENARAMGIRVETDGAGRPVRWDGYEVVGGELAAISEEVFYEDAAYVPLARYNGGDWDESDLIEVDHEWPDQEGERINGWYGPDYGQPNYVTARIRPGDDAYDRDAEWPDVLAAARAAALAEWEKRKAAAAAAA